MNPNRVSNTNKFKSIWARIDINQISNPKQSELIRVGNDSDWKFGLDKSELGFIRINASDLTGINRIESDCFSIDLHRTRLKTFFGMIRNGSKTDFLMTRNNFYFLGSWV